MFLADWLNDILDTSILGIIELCYLNNEDTYRPVTLSTT
jgi:hypothetical protein